MKTKKYYIMVDSERVFFDTKKAANDAWVDAFLDGKQLQGDVRECIIAGNPETHDFRIRHIVTETKELSNGQLKTHEIGLEYNYYSVEIKEADKDTFLHIKKNGVQYRYRLKYTSGMYFAIRKTFVGAMDFDWLLCGLRSELAEGYPHCHGSMLLDRIIEYTKEA